MHGHVAAKRSDKTQHNSASPGVSVALSAGNQRQQIREALTCGGQGEQEGGQDSGQVIQKQALAPHKPEIAQRQSEVIQRQPEITQRQPEEEEEELLQPKFQDGEAAAPVFDETAGIGTGMPGSLQAGLETLSSLDLSATRVYSNSSEPAKVNALAYTRGQDIYLAPGQEKHLPHEGWHVVQQLQGRVKPSRQVNGQTINDDASLEHEADVMGARAQQMNLPETKATQQPVPESKGQIDNPAHARASSPAAKPAAAQHKCEQCGPQEDIVTQTKTMTNIDSGIPGFKIDGLTSVRSISLPTSIQRQAGDDDVGEEDPQKKAEYDALKPQGGGAGTTAATVTGGAQDDNEAVQLKANDVMQRVACTPGNTAVGRGALSFAEESRESWRSHFTYRASVDNQSDHLSISMYVFAKVYYGFWATSEHINFSATVDLTCQSAGTNSCEISANERGGSVWDLTHSPAAGAISVQTDSRASGTQMGLTVRVGGSVGASGSVSAGVGPASAGVSFPDASLSHKMSMGTFIYTCQR